MALVFGDSFDHYPIADILKKWSSQTNAVASVMSTADALRPHHQCLIIAGAVGYFEKILTTPLTTFIFGFWYYYGLIGTASIIFAGQDSATPATEHVSLRIDSTGHLTFTRNATVLATSTNVLSNATWYHIEGKVTIGDAGDAPSGQYQVRVDGTAVNWIPDSGAGKDTRNGGNATIGSIRLGCANNNSLAGSHYQDFYLLNTTGAQASDFLGPSRFAVLRPVTAGTTAEWTGNYADNWVNVSEILADGDQTFNQSSTAGQTDQFTMTDVPAGTVHAIQHVIMAKRDAGGGRTIRPVTRIGGTDYNGTTKTVAASYEFHCEAVNVSPATSAAWDDDELNAAEFGYELVS